MKFLIPISVLLFFSCNNNEPSNEKVMESAGSSEKIDIKRGKELFLNNCSQCHASLIHSNASLRNFWKNIPKSSDKKKFYWLKSYLSNSDSLFKENDYYTIILKEKYDTIESHKIILNNKELLDLLTYIRKSE